MLQCSSFMMPIKAYMAGRWPKSSLSTAVPSMHNVIFAPSVPFVVE